jgi:oligopeptidase B
MKRGKSVRLVREVRKDGRRVVQMSVRQRLRAAAGLALATMAACSARTGSQSEIAMNSNKLTAPVAAEHHYAVPSPHGERIDPYYWLRDDERDSKEVLDYLAAENTYTDALMAHTKPLQEKLYNEIIGRIKQDDSTVPYRKRGYWYYRRYETGKEYPIYARKQEKLDAPEQILLDVNKLAEGHDFFQVGSYDVSPDNRLLAWTEDDVGRRQFTLRVRNLDTGETLSDQVTNIDAGFAWVGDNKTIVYVAKDPVTLLGDKVRKHVLGHDAKHDALVYEEHDKSFFTSVGTTKDEAFVAIVSQSTVSSEMRVAKSGDPKLSFRVLIPRERDHEYHADHLSGKWIVRGSQFMARYRRASRHGVHRQLRCVS